jgi:uncharacterized membrane protein
MMNWENYGYGGVMGFGPIFMIILVALIIIGAIYFLKRSAAFPRFKGSGETSLDILKKRLAKDVEFDEIKRNIE